MSRAARRYLEASEEINPGSTPSIDDPQLYECPLCPLPKGHDGDCHRPPAFVRMSNGKWRHRICGTHTDDPTSHRCPAGGDVKGEA